MGKDKHHNFKDQLFVSHQHDTACTKSAHVSDEDYGIKNRQQVYPRNVSKDMSTLLYLGLRHTPSGGYKEDVCRVRFCMTLQHVSALSSAQWAGYRRASPPAILHRCIQSV